MNRDKTLKAMTVINIAYFHQGLKSQAHVVKQTF